MVQTGVKSAGCEKRIPHESPSHWWKSISPWVVLALKFGAVEPRRRRGCSCEVVARYLQRVTGKADLGWRSRNGVGFAEIK